MSGGHPLATPDDLHAYRGIVMAAQRLKMRQAVTLEDAWAILLQTEHGPETMPEDDAERTRSLLMEFDYSEFLVRPVNGEEVHRLWIRPDWPTERLELVPFD